MLDFTSSLYLGFAHPSDTLAPWRALTLGRPAALVEPPGATQLAADLARLTGAEAGLLFPSTLHLFRDLFSESAAEGAILLMDAKAYPITRWGTEQVRLRGTACEAYSHHDAAALAQRARREFRAGLRPIIVTDGLCPACGRLAPLPELARVAADCGGRLIVDDTQALGVVGRPAGNAMPLGTGGGGTLAWFGLYGAHVYAGSSLAKGFGAPLAVLLGGKDTVAKIARDGESRIHSSPPSVAAITAACAALSANATQGDLLRARLSRRVRQLRQGLVAIGARVLSALPLPVQTIALTASQSARAVLEGLDTRGIRALVTEASGSGPALSIILTARHTAADIDRLIDALASVLHHHTHSNRTRTALS